MTTDRAILIWVMVNLSLLAVGLIGAVTIVLLGLV